MLECSNLRSMRCANEIETTSTEVSEALSDEIGVNDVMNEDAVEMLDRFRSGDESLLAALRGKNGSAVMLKLQDAMNQENRLMTFLSQKLNIEHETQKSIIQNIR